MTETPPWNGSFGEQKLTKEKIGQLHPYNNWSLDSRNEKGKYLKITYQSKWLLISTRIWYIDIVYLVSPKDYRSIRYTYISWWHHQKEIFSMLLAICAGNSMVNSPPKGQWWGALMFSLICAWTNSWVNNWDAGDLRRHHAHYDTVFKISVGPRTLTSKIWVGPASFPSLSYMNFGKIVLRSGKFEIFNFEDWWHQCNDIYIYIYIS